MDIVEARRRVISEIDSRTSEITDLASRLIQVPSVSGEEAQCQEYFASVCESMGLQVDKWVPDLDDVKGILDVPPRPTITAPVVVGTRTGTGGGRSLILSGHIDVVPAGDPGLWKHGPWSGAVAGGRVYGRGATDMKGGIAAMVMALKCITDAGVSLKGTVHVASVTEEETGGLGIVSLVKRGYRADGALIPEPSDMRVCSVQEGSLWFRVTVKGLAAHAGTKYFGVSAIEKAFKLINALYDLEAIREKQFRTRFFRSYPIAFPLNVGTIKGGDWPSTVPEKVQFEARLGLGPGESADTARKQVEDFVSRVAALDPWMATSPPSVEWFGNQCKSYFIDPEHPFVQSVLKAATTQLGGEREPEGVPWGTDGSTLVNVAGVPTVVFGPGTMPVAHMVDEYVDVKRLVDCCKVIACSMLDWCQVS